MDTFVIRIEDLPPGVTSIPSPCSAGPRRARNCGPTRPCPSRCSLAASPTLSPSTRSWQRTPVQPARSRCWPAPGSSSTHAWHRAMWQRACKAWTLCTLRATGGLPASAGRPPRAAAGGDCPFVRCRLPEVRLGVCESKSVMHYFCGDAGTRGLEFSRRGKEDAPKITVPP